MAEFPIQGFENEYLNQESEKDMASQHEQRLISVVRIAP